MTNTNEYTEIVNQIENCLEQYKEKFANPIVFGGEIYPVDKSFVHFNDFHYELFDIAKQFSNMDDLLTDVFDCLDETELADIYTTLKPILSKYKGK